MKHLPTTLRHNYSKLYRIFIVLVAFGLILLVSPRETTFKYEYVTGYPWMHEDLYAPFDFPIEKPDAVIEKEKEAIARSNPLYFRYENDVVDSAISSYGRAVSSYLLAGVDSVNRAKTEKQLLQKGNSLLKSIYKIGVLEGIDSLENKPADYQIKVVKDRKEINAEIGNYLTLKQAFELIKESVANDKQAPANLSNLLAGVLTPNIVYDRALTKRVLNEKTNVISMVYGKVSQGEIIVGRGEVVNEEISQKLISFKNQREGRTGTEKNMILVFIGKAIYGLIGLFLIIVYLRLFAPDIYSGINKFTLIIILFLINYYLAGITMYFDQVSIYVMPFAAFAIIMQSFFRTDIVAYLYIIFLLIAALVAPNGLAFLWIEIPAGLAAIFFLTELRKRSQLISVIGIIFIVTSAVYLATELLSESSIAGVKWQNFAWFATSALLTLLAIPMVFLIERLFGLVSEMALLELVDTNNKLLRQLSLKAPGTLQHSLQVANLAEECALEIGGDPLLVRVGALYHDVGKMKNPSYFIENQTGDFNPHTDLSPKESAAIIINHVVDGVTLAKKHKIPEKIIDFIRTHHGTTVTRYFLYHARQDNPDADEKLFQYPGPLPFSKETAILMMCDGVEAASRSLPEYTKESVDQLVDSIIDYLVQAGQLSFAPITLEEISILKKLLKRKLMTIYHVRVAYPS